jgi:hypothetical protein
VSNEKHDPSKSSEYKNFQVPTDWSRIYFKTGIFVPVVTNVMEHRFLSTLYVNDSEIGFIYSGQVMVVDLKPGTYSLYWNRKGMMGGYIVTKKEITLKPGEYIIASSDLKQSGEEQGSAFFGLLGALVGGALRPNGEYSIAITDQRNQIDVSQFVKPVNCRPSFCKPD